jgi:hypothetical protein
VSPHSAGALAFAAVLGIISVSNQSQGANQPGLVLSREPDGAASDIAMRIVGDAMTASLTFYVRQSGGTPLDGVRLFVRLQNETGQSVTGPTVTFQVSDPVDRIAGAERT